jgi:hypothetical protein
MKTQEIQKHFKIPDTIREVRKCPGCGSIMFATPVLTCSHCGREMPIRCFYYKSGSKFYAQCLDLNLISRGETAEDAVGRLQESMVGYVNAVMEGGSSKGLLPRPAPFLSWIHFYLHRIASRVKRWSVRRDKNHNVHFQFSGGLSCRCD